MRTHELGVENDGIQYPDVLHAALFEHAEDTRAHRCKIVECIELPAIGFDAPVVDRRNDPHADRIGFERGHGDARRVNDECGVVVRMIVRVATQPAVTSLSPSSR